ncbi:MAG: heme-binding protein, partial [Methanobacterium sp.]
DYDSAIGIGFSILAKYIFGSNKKRKSIPMTTPVSEEKIEGSEKIPMAAPVTQESVGSEKIPMASPVTQEPLKESEKIAMAAPVTEEEANENIHRISFTMPSKYTLKTLPEPDDERIKFKEVKNQKTAVLRFSGRVKKKLAIKKMEEMRKWLEKYNLKPKSNFVVAQYNNPAVPGFFRRNEILVEIE